MSSTPNSGEKPTPKAALGLPSATALVIGSIIGTGVFALPSALAPYGPISLVAFGVVTLGALALAVTFGALSKRVPASGGPYVYAREAFGEFAGFLNAWSYWITAWAGTPPSWWRGSDMSRSSSTPATARRCPCSSR